MKLAQHWADSDNRAAATPSSDLPVNLHLSLLLELDNSCEQIGTAHAPAPPPPSGYATVNVPLFFMLHLWQEQVLVC